jgi:hypothetical protein
MQYRHKARTWQDDISVPRKTQNSADEIRTHKHGPPEHKEQDSRSKKNGIKMMRFQVLMAASMKMTVFWVVAPCSLVEVYRRLRGACCLHHQGDRRVDL